MQQRLRVSLLATVIGLSLMHAAAQQHPQYSLFAFNNAAYNPAAVGIDNFFSFTAHGRYQWVGISGAPSSQNVSVQLPLLPWKSDVGLIVINNQQGLQRNTEASLQYNYRLWQRRAVWTIGVQGGVIQSSLNGSKIITPQGTYSDNTVDHNDPQLVNATTSGLQPTFGAGIAVMSKHVKAGVAAQYLNTPKLSLTEKSHAPVMQRQYFSYLTYNFKISRSVKLVPSVMIKYDGNDLQHEANATLEHSRYGWLGLGFRGFTASSRDAAYGILGIRLSKKWIAAYSYDFGLSALGNASNGSHELLLRYETALTTVARPGKIIYTPRF